MQALQDTYGGDVYLHENSWPGLAGILTAMQLLMIFLYAMVTLFVLIVTLLTTEKLLRLRKKIYAFTVHWDFLPCSFDALLPCVLE